MANDMDWEGKHRKFLARLDNEISKIYEDAAAEAARIGVTIGGIGDEMFNFEQFPVTHARIGALLDTFRSKIEAATVNGVASQWDLANGKADDLCRAVFGPALKSLTEVQRQRYFGTHEAARAAFIKRKANGMGLSERVWRLTKQYRRELEMGIDIGLREGMSAPELSRELRSYLTYPDKLFRRVRDRHGQLALSRHARQFHPGQGVYRSSFMNARRLAVTEANMAFRTADYERCQDLDFVVGIEVRLSNNHNCRGVPDGRFSDICDTLQGKYPKGFKFTGWHPHCRCYVTSVLKTKREIERDNERIMRGLEPLPSRRKVDFDGLRKFEDWADKNRDRIKAAKSMPYFLKDNTYYTDKTYHADNRLNERIDRLLDRHGISHTQQTVRTAAPQVYKERIAENKRLNPNGWMVDVHDDYSHERCFLTEDMKSGIAVTADGDIVSLFSSAWSDHRMEKLIMIAIESGGVKCDCYGGGLQNLYARFGAVAAGRTPFNADYAPPDWNGKDRFDIVAMIFPKTAREAAKRFMKRTIKLEEIRLFDDYEEMLKYRDGLLHSHHFSI